jgi:cyclophilin family peptidyl-prolyl cis-trans isomerase
VADVQLLPRMPLPTERELAEDVQAVVTMESGRTFALRFATVQAPLARTRFVRLARTGYYDGLTFHRVVANAFIQGGSPHANEYAGDRLYMRDEVGVEMHTRGSVGISTRGRDTGDAQIFINLVDNPFLDYQYTVFARVCGDGMETVDRIQEADRIRRIQIESADECK